FSNHDFLARILHNFVERNLYPILMTKKNVAVIMGGYSSEFEISIQSGTVVSGAISKDKYQVYPVHILKNNWFYKAENGTEYSVNRADFSFSDGKNTIKPD